jgi:membrane-bound lytic murein transglycosylase B
MVRHFRTMGRFWAATLVVAGCALTPIAEAASRKVAQGPSQVSEPADKSDFRRFVESLWPEAQARGISRATFDEALQGVSLDPKIVALTRKQSEFNQPIWDYLDGAVSAARLARGRELTREWSQALDGVERIYGVPRSIVLGVWGMESNFGSFTGSIDVVRALATLAFVRYRGDFFRDELFNAMRILQQDHVDRDKLLGSWAGAMGQTQFMPSSFLKYAVDGDGDGRRDIWASVPDALASTANFLRQQGWQPGLPWGFEVALPQGIDLRQNRRGFAAWESAGLRRVDGKAMPRSGEATLFLPAGARGPAFLVTDNYLVIKTYNSSDAYALGVALLGDRLLGAPPIQGAWPKGEPMLDLRQRQEVQKRLQQMGHDVGEPDGKIGSKTREAVRQFQLQRGLAPDGYADVNVLNALRASR